MAEECNLLRYFRLIYQPASSDIHGDWSSIRNVNLTRCMNPLHRFHRIPQRLEPSLFITPLSIAVEIVVSAIEFCEKHYGFPHFECNLIDVDEVLE